MVEWLCSYIGDYKLKKTVSDKTNVRVMGEGRVLSPKGTQIVIRTYLTHPEYHDLLDVNLIPELKALRPEERELKFTEVITLHNRPAELYQTNKNRCSIIMEGKKRVIIELFTLDCKDLDELVEFAELLDVERLERKLGQ